MPTNLDTSLPTASILSSKANLNSSPSVDGKIERINSIMTHFFVPNERTYVKGRLVRPHQTVDD